MKDKLNKNKMLELISLINYSPNDISFLEKAIHCQIIHASMMIKIERNILMIV